MPGEGKKFPKGGKPGPGRPKGSKDKGVRLTGPRAASQSAEVAAAANGAPPPADLAVKTTSIRAALEQIDTHFAETYRQAVLLGLAADPPKSAPYVELVTRYRVGKPPDAGDSERLPLIFWLGKGPPGGYDPLALPPAGQAEPPRQVIDVTPAQAPPAAARPPLRPPGERPPPPAARPEDPDELLPLR